MKQLLQIDFLLIFFKVRYVGPYLTHLEKKFKVRWFGPKEPSPRRVKSGPVLEIHAMFGYFKHSTTHTFCGTHSLFGPLPWHSGEE